MATVCVPFSNSGCIDDNVRLIGGQNSSSGKVEVCVEEIWLPVCSDMWDERHAAVVCRQLGFSGCEFEGNDSR